MEDLRYPVGRFTMPEQATDADLQAWIDEIDALPARLRAAVATLDDARLDTPYRSGGWTVRQLVHHVADSHLNSIIRFKLALTEDQPTIRPYDQDAWVNLPDARMPVGVSLDLLQHLHARWVTLLRALDRADLERVFLHPESGPHTLRRAIALYAWHGRHHLAHVTGLKTREGWT